MKKLTQQDKTRFKFDYDGPLHNPEVTITITDTISNNKREVRFISILNLTNEAVENIIKENIDTMKSDNRDNYIKELIK